MLRWAFVIPIALGCNFSGGPGSAEDLIDASADARQDDGGATDGAAIDGAPTGLSNDGLVVRYFIDEADSGQDPMQLLDRSGVGAPQNLDIVTTGANPAFTGDGQNRGLRWTATGQAGEVDGDLMSHNRLRNAINNAQELTIELVLDITTGGGSNDGSVVLAVGADNFVLNAKDADNLSLSVAGNEQGRWDLDLIGGRTVVHVVFDSNQNVAGDRVRLFRNGTLVSSETDASVDGGASLSANNGDHFVLGNSDGGQESFQGNIFYAAIYATALSDASKIVNAARLLADDDE